MKRKEYDIYIKNAVVHDPHLKKTEKRDLLTKKNRIVEIPENFSTDMAVQTVEAEGLHLCPSLTENHSHLYFGGGDCNINPDVIMIPQGVTNAVDQGSSGWSNFPLFRKQTDTSMMNLKCYLNVSNSGLITEDYYENIEPALMNEEMIEHTVKNSGGRIIGLKIRICRDSVKDMTTKPLERALQIAEDLSLPLSVHIKDVDDLSVYSSLLRKGDTWVHIFQQEGQTAFDENGKLRKCVLDARKRGVLFDIAGGRSSFSIDMIRNAKLQDFETDFIGTDLVSYNVYQRPLFSMVNMMNVYLNLGFGLEELIKKVTVNPAETMKMNGITDTVKEGSCADLFLFKLKEKRTVMKDNHGGEIEAEKMIVPVMTVKDGSVLYRNIEY